MKLVVVVMLSGICMTEMCRMQADFIFTVAIHMVTGKNSTQKTFISAVLRRKLNMHEIFLLINK